MEGGLEVELKLFGEGDMPKYMLNYFIHPDELNLLRILKEIHVFVDSCSCHKISRLPNGKIIWVPNPKTEVLTMIPRQVVNFFLESASEVRFNEKTLEVYPCDLIFSAKLRFPEIMESILGEGDEYLRREFIAMLKILAGPPPDFLITPREITVIEPGKRRVVFPEEISVPKQD